MLQIFKSIFFAILILGINHHIIGQTKLFTNDELPSEHIYQITQDSKGFIWILTQEGLVKYNGNQIKIFSKKDGLPTNSIYSSQVTGNKLWYMCKGNKQGFIRNDSVFTFKFPAGTFTYSHLLIKENDLLISDLKGNLCQIKGNKWEISKLNNYKYPKTAFHSFGIDYYEFSKKVISFYHKNKLLFSIPYDFNANFVVIQSFPNNLISITTKKEIYFVETKTIKVNKMKLSLKPNQELHGSSLRFVNNQFQVSYRDFVGVLNDSFQIEYSFNIDPKLKAHANFIDKDKNIWIGSFESGIHFLSNKYQSSQIQHQLSSTFGPVFFENKLYFLSNRGLYEFGNSNPIFIAHSNLYPPSQINNTLLFAHNNLMLSKGKVDNNPKYFIKIANVIPNQLIKYKNKYVVKDVKRVLVLSNEFEIIKSHFFIANDLVVFRDTAFILTNEGLYFLDRKDSIVKHSVNINASLKCHSILNDQLLLGTENEGLMIYSNGIVENVSLNEATINALATYNSEYVYCATNFGLIALQKDGNNYQPYYNYTKADGLSSIHTTGVAIDDKKNIYITTHKGITRTKLILPGQVASSLNPIYISSIRWNDKIIKIKDSLLFKHKTGKALDITFDCIHFDYKSTINYAYKLVKNNIGEWVETTNGKVHLSDLPIGEYLLYLKVENPFVASSQKTLHLSIEARWHETLFFKIITVILLLLLMGFSLNYWYKNKNAQEFIELKKEAEKSNFKLTALRSQMNPHFVFNSLNAIQYYINENENELSETYLLKFSKLIREFFDLSNEKDITLERELKLLNNYLSLEQMRFEHKLFFTINVDKLINTKSAKIPSMLLQPIIENAVNHGIFHKEEKGIVTIDFIYINPLSFQVIISDDGIGIINSKILKEKSIQGHISKSTAIFKERIVLLNKTESWKIDYNISSLTTNEKYPGTKVTINITYNDQSNTNR